MTDLNKKVFGKITIKEIIGAYPPAIPDTKKLLENEFYVLINELEVQTKDSLKEILNKQYVADKHINSRPGAMALAQDKIRLFTEYNEKYIKIINEKLNS